MAADQGGSSRSVVVLGAGPVFERRFAEALRLAGFRRLASADEGGAAVVLSHLDSAAEATEAAPEPHWVVIGGPAGGGPSLPAEVSAESLLFFVSRALPLARDQRRDPRVLAPLLVRYRRDAEVGDSGRRPVRQGELLDVSRGGAFIRSLMPPRVGERLELEIAAGPGGAVAVAGTVVRALRVDLEQGIVHADGRPGVPVPSHPGFGVVFDPAGTSVLDRLDALVAVLAGAPPA